MNIISVYRRSALAFAVSPIDRHQFCSGSSLAWTGFLDCVRCSSAKEYKYISFGYTIEYHSFGSNAVFILKKRVDNTHIPTKRVENGEISTRFAGICVLCPPATKKDICIKYRHYSQVPKTYGTFFFLIYILCGQ